MVKLFLILFMLLVFGCTHFSSKYKDTDALLSDPRLQNLSINVRCAVLDLNGKILRTFTGLFCQYQDDGSVFTTGGSQLLKFDKNLNKLWEYKIIMSHHQMVLSPHTSNLLLLDITEYKQNEQWYRGDILLVMDSNGQVLKRLKFDDILAQAESMGFKSKPPEEATWISNKIVPHRSILERSHVNSFYEIWDEASGKVTGYIVNCYLQQKIYILDAQAEKLVRVIDMDSRRIHDVQMYRKNLYFYVNSDEKMGKPWLSYIGSYDLATGAIQKIYRVEEQAYRGNACSSVQMLGDGLFAILHSNCAPTPETAAKPTFEIIDVNHKLRYRPNLEKVLTATNGYLFNSQSFLGSNKGF